MFYRYNQQYCLDLIQCLNPFNIYLESLHAQAPLPLSHLFLLMFWLARLYYQIDFSGRNCE